MAEVPFLASPGRGVPERGHSPNLPWDMWVLIGIATLLTLTASLAYGYHYRTAGRFLVSTDNATIQAASTTISPRVSGHIAEVLVKDNEPVHAGQVLARLDDRDYRTAVAAGQADVQAGQNAINYVEHEIKAQQLALTQAHAIVTADHAALISAQEHSGHRQEIARTRGGPPQDVQRRSDDLLQKAAAFARDTSTMDASETQFEALKAALAQERAALLRRQVALRQAGLNLSYTTITSPISGTTGVWAQPVGQYVRPGTRLTMVVPLDSVYVIANYKQTQITDIQPGQPATVATDMFPGTLVYGSVDSIAPATEEHLNSQSRDNGIGDFSETVQHVPVKIVIDPSNPLLGQLRPGVSVEATINTHE